MNDLSNSNQNSNNGDQKKKGALLWSTMKHSLVNCSARTMAASKNTKETIKIKQLQVKLEQRKNDFGVEYMNLLLMGGTTSSSSSPLELQLQQCVDQARADITRLQNKTTKFQGYIATNKEQLERKLKGGGAKKGSSHHDTCTSPSIVVTSAELAPAASGDGDEENSSSTMAKVASSPPTTLSVTRTEHDDDHDDDVTAINQDGVDGVVPAKRTEPSQPFDEDGPLPHPTPSAPTEETNMQSID